MSPDPVPFGIESFTATAEEEGGAPSEAAGIHPFQWTNSLQFNAGRLRGNARASGTKGIEQPALPRNTRVTFPAGLAGTALASERCDFARFVEEKAGASGRVFNECPAQSAVGVASVTIVEPQVFGLVRLAVPIFNLTPGDGEPARFGFLALGVPVVIDTSVDPSDEYRISGEVRNAPQVVQVLSATITLWGTPGDPRHNAARGWECLAFTGKLLGAECTDPSAPPIPFLRMPVSCATPLEHRGEAEPWNTPLGAAVSRVSFLAPAPRGCSKVPFDPQVASTLTSKAASSPSGLQIRVDMPNSGFDNPEEGALSEAQFKRAEVILPKGVTVNPSAAEGLAVCTEADYERERYDSRPGEGCPEASKLGSVKISTPLLEEEVEGALYQATPYENKTGSLLAVYLVARIPERGVLVKQPIEVRPDPLTGQLVSVAENVPQLPFSSFEFHFREGGRAPLIAPPGCGSFATTARFSPWSAADPDNPTPDELATRTATFTIERGVGGGACPQGQAPFHPGFEAGTLNNQAGSYSPFVMRLTRNDGEQDMGKFSFVLPPGVVPKLAGIPYCSDAGIARAQSRQGPHGGQEEKEDPSCPAASEIGTTVAGAGAGSQLTYVPGKLYLAGPYHGDPISAVSITPAVAGPFDAGTVVVREAPAPQPRHPRRAKSTGRPRIRSPTSSRASR